MSRFSFRHFSRRLTLEGRLTLTIHWRLCGEETKMRNEMMGAALALLSLAGSAPAQNQPAAAQEQPMKLKGGHLLGETAEQFFAEGYEKGAFIACKAEDFKSLDLPGKRELKDYCQKLADARQEATSGKRSEYKGGGDVSELRDDTFTFDEGRLVKLELHFSAPSAEFNYRGQSFEKIFEGTKQAYGPPSSETTEPVQDTYGARYLAHRELWLTSQTAILITEKAGPGGSTTLAAFTRAEYNRTVADAAKTPNPLQ